MPLFPMALGKTNFIKVWVSLFKFLENEKKKREMKYREKVGNAANLILHGCNNHGCKVVTPEPAFRVRSLAALTARVREQSGIDQQGPPGSQKRGGEQGAFSSRP